MGIRVLQRPASERSEHRNEVANPLVAVGLVLLLGRNCPLVTFVEQLMHARHVACRKLDVEQRRRHFLRHGKLETSEDLGLSIR